MEQERNLKIIAIIQAHMSSTRLPEKIMLDLCGKPVLYRVVERARQCKLLDDIVIATSDLPCDDVVEAACTEWGVSCCRGSDTDVLSRYWVAAQQHPSDAYMRLTSDNPLIDPDVLTDAILFFQKHDYRYIHTDSRLPLGMGAELFEANLLREAAENATEPFEHEHVTPYMYWKQSSVGEAPINCAENKYRLTVDTPEDYDVVSSVYGALYHSNPRFSLSDILLYLDLHPEIAEKNKLIVQKQAKD